MESKLDEYHFNTREIMSIIQISGQFYQGNSSDFQTAIALFNCNGLIEISSDSQNDLIISAEIAQVKISDKLANTPRQVIFNDGCLFSFVATDEIELWLNIHGKKSLIDKLEQNKKLAFTAFILVPTLLIAVFKFAIPAIAINFASIIPQSAIKHSSEHSLSTLDKTVLSASKLSTQVRESYQQTWKSKIDTHFTSANNYKILFRKSVYFGANAFALPDGTIVVTDDLIKLFDKHPEALFAILLHEIGHVEQQHSMRYIAESVATAIVVNYLFGDVSGMIDLFVGSGATIISNKFSQKLEWEADNFAIEALKQQGASTESFAQAMELLLSTTDETALEQLFSTHPLLKERANNARK